MHRCLTTVALGLMTIPGARPGASATTKQPGVIAISECSQDRSFTVLGKKTRVASDLPLSDSLAQAARAAANAGMRSVIIKSRCKLTTSLLAEYCDAFAAEKVHVVNVIVPVGDPRAPRTLHCGDESF